MAFDNSSLTYNSKVSNGLSFYTLKDSSGSTQLVVSGGQSSGILELIRGIQPESSVLVEGEVKHRPLSSRRPVSTTVLGDRVSDCFVGIHWRDRDSGRPCTSSQPCDFSAAIHTLRRHEPGKCVVVYFSTTLNFLI
jgi:hypothetical protein